MKMEKFLRRGVLTATLFTLVMFLPVNAYAVGENPGELGTPTISLVSTTTSTDTTRVRIIVRGGSDGCGAYNISLFVPSEGKTDRPVATARGDALRPGRSRTHFLTVNLRHNPASTHVIAGFVSWGPDAQVPIPEIRIRDADLHRR